MGAGNLEVSVRCPHRGMGRADGCVSLGLQAEARSQVFLVARQLLMGTSLPRDVTHKENHPLGTVRTQYIHFPTLS